MNLQEGILLPWNPALQPETLRVHVEAHRRSPSRRTWWGRISRGKSEEYSLAPVAHALALMSTEPERRPVLVTDYVRLHALKVDLVSGECPAAERPAYYDQLPNTRVPLWLRVKDVRALSHDPLVTLEFLQKNIRTKSPESPYGFDPYASTSQPFPQRIFAPSNDVLFDPVGAPPSGYYADAPDAIDRPITEEAFHRLAGAWGAQTWERLSPFTRECLAHADALFRDDRYGILRRDDADSVPVLVQLVRAVERELVTELLQPLLEVSKRPGGPAAASGLEEALSGLKGELTLGSFNHVLHLGRLREWSRRHLGDGPAVRLLGESEWHRWIAELVGHRNATLHSRNAAAASYVRGLARALLEPGDGPPARALETIAAAKQQVREAMAGGERTTTGAV